MAKKKMVLATKSAADVHTKLAMLRDSKAFKKAVFKGGSTEPLDLEAKRRAMEEIALQLNAITGEIVAEYRSPEQDLVKVERLYNLANLAALGATPRGFANQFDCLTVREPCRVKKSDGTIVKGFRRRSLAEIMFMSVEAVDNTNFLLYEYLLPMLEEAGQHQQWWRDENGIPDPNKWARAIAEDFQDEEKLAEVEAKDAELPQYNEGEQGVVEETDQPKPQPVDHIGDALKERIVTGER